MLAIVAGSTVLVAFALSYLCIYLRAIRREIAELNQTLQNASEAASAHHKAANEPDVEFMLEVENPSNADAGFYLVATNHHARVPLTNLACTVHIVPLPGGEALILSHPQFIRLEPREVVRLKLDFHSSWSEVMKRAFPSHQDHFANIWRLRHDDSDLAVSPPKLPVSSSENKASVVLHAKYQPRYFGARPVNREIHFSLYLQKRAV
jgi:hypothetical protein